MSIKIPHLLIYIILAGSNLAFADDMASKQSPTITDAETGISSNVSGSSDGLENDGKSQSLITDDIRAALQTQRDEFGIPIGIYNFDRKLIGYRQLAIDAQSNSIIYGIAGGCLVAGGIVLSLAAPDLVWAPFYVETPIQYGYFVAGLGTVFLICDLCFIMPDISKRKTELKFAYEQTYGTDD
jgi:hypothetical protein